MEDIGAQMSTELIEDSNNPGLMKQLCGDDYPYPTVFGGPDTTINQTKFIGASAIVQIDSRNYYE